MRSVDTAVIGLGIMGSAAAYALSRQPGSVVCFERSRGGETGGSSRGTSRIFRQAYFEGEIFKDLLASSMTEWAALEEIIGARLLETVGLLHIGRRDGAMLARASASAKFSGIALDDVSADLARRFLAFSLPAGWSAFFETGAGFIHADRALHAFRQLAARQGAELLFETPVTRLSAEPDAVIIGTQDATFQAKRCVVTVGPWLAALLPDLKQSLEAEKKLEVTRQSVSWFATPPDRGAFPAFVVELASGNLAYGLPDFEGRGIKAAYHTHGARLDDATLWRQDWSPEEALRLADELGSVQPSALGTPMEGDICLYTNLAEERFLIDWHPRHRNILLVSACSGHGFKMASGIGALVAAAISAQAPLPAAFRW